MYRNWFDSIYQTKNLVKARLEFIDDDGKVTGLTANNIGDDVHLHVRDNLTGQMFHFPCRILAIRLSTEVWYDLFIYTNEERTLGMRANRIRGEHVSTHPINENEERDFDAKELTSVLSQAIESGELELEPKDEAEDLAPVAIQETPITWFGKQFYIFRPLRLGTTISRLFVQGRFEDIVPVAQLGDDVMIGDGQGSRLCEGVVCEIHAEDEFYYSVAIPIVCPQGERYAVVQKLHADDVRLLPPTPVDTGPTPIARETTPEPVSLFGGYYISRQQVKREELLDELRRRINKGYMPSSKREGFNMKPEYVRWFDMALEGHVSSARNFDCMGYFKRTDEWGLTNTDDPIWVYIETNQFEYLVNLSTDEIRVRREGEYTWTLWLEGGEPLPEDKRELFETIDNFL